MMRSNLDGNRAYWVMKVSAHKWINAIIIELAVAMQMCLLIEVGERSLTPFFLLPHDALHLVYGTARGLHKTKHVTSQPPKHLEKSLYKPASLVMSAKMHEGIQSKMLQTKQRAVTV